MTPALSLIPAQRIAPVSDGLRLVRTELVAPVFRGSAQARNLDERIEEFDRDTPTAGLHGYPASPCLDFYAAARANPGEPSPRTHPNVGRALQEL